jgi:hypothetical protein
VERRPAHNAPWIDLDKDAGARVGNAELLAVAVERALSAGGDDIVLAPGSVAFSTDGPPRPSKTGREISCRSPAP